MDRDDPAYRGQRDYGRLLLTLYDPIVIGVVAKLVWRVPPGPMLDMYRRHIRDGHLDIGPGTGYSIDHSGLPTGAAPPSSIQTRPCSGMLRSACAA